MLFVVDRFATCRFTTTLPLDGECERASKRMYVCVLLVLVAWLVVYIYLVSSTCTYPANCTHNWIECINVYACGVLVHCVCDSFVCVCVCVRVCVLLWFYMRADHACLYAYKHTNALWLSNGVCAWVCVYVLMLAGDFAAQQQHQMHTLCLRCKQCCQIDSDLKNRFLLNEKHTKERKSY